MKQTTYITAKQNPVNPPELFASILASHFVTTYSHIHAATVSVIQHRWTRMTVDGKPHPHSFFRDGDETRHAEARATKESIAVHSAIRGLLVLKSTGSAFHGFIDDEYTILKPTNDRILSTEVDCGWAWTPLKGIDEVKATAEKFDAAWAKGREITMATFANDSSASVQNTMYKMCEQILAAEPGVASVDYALPNKHYFEIGSLNITPFDISISCRKLTGISRLELAQGPEEYRQGRRSVCASVESQRLDQMYRHTVGSNNECGKLIQKIQNNPNSGRVSYQH